MADATDRRAAFRALHASGCFVLPNPWDVGSARYLQHLGFPALATTSAGAAFSMGLPDAAWAVPVEAMLDHIATIVAATDLPVNADFESGYADELADLGKNVRRCVATGVAGLSIEDLSPDGATLFPLEVAVERIRTARAAIEETGADVVLTGRCEAFLVDHPDALTESVRRLRAYAEAGADCLYAPAPPEPDVIAALVRAVAPKPVNVIVSSTTPLTVADVAALGARRISTGSALARAAWGGFRRAAEAIAREGRFDPLADAFSFGELNAFFQADHHRRRAEEGGA